ncbi:hypothetical protein I79_023759 [Cricetulus griseus]|uniref:Uncharacterized protein n=1 Tax=Cricetulus griseus TaxID=10029 RepID=G3IIT4_CRIGR|nr:hypothetical protein I79_023759 [Cricetulus griseus]
MIPLPLPFLLCLTCTVEAGLQFRIEDLVVAPAALVPENHVGGAGVVSGIGRAW